MLMVVNAIANNAEKWHNHVEDFHILPDKQSLQARGTRCLDRECHSIILLKLGLGAIHDSWT